MAILERAQSAKEGVSFCADTWRQGRITRTGRSDLITAEVLWIVFGLKLIIFVITLIIGTMVGVRNGNRDFQPPLRSHIELFLAGVPIGFVGMTLILPAQTEAAYFAVAGGVFTGLVYTYTLPRHWRSLQRRLQRKRKEHNRSS